MIHLTKRQRQQMKDEAKKEAGWDNSALSMDRIADQAQAMSNAHKLGMGTLQRGKKRCGATKCGKIAMPSAGGGGNNYRLVRLQNIG